MRSTSLASSGVLQCGEDRADQRFAIDVEEVVDALAVGAVAVLLPAGGVLEERLVGTERERGRDAGVERQVDRIVDLGRGEVGEPEVLGLGEELLEGQGELAPRPGGVLVTRVGSIDDDAFVGRDTRQRDRGERQGQDHASNQDTHLLTSHLLVCWEGVCPCVPPSRDRCPETRPDSGPAGNGLGFMRVRRCFQRSGTIAGNAARDASA